MAEAQNKKEFILKQLTPKLAAVIVPLLFFAYLMGLSLQFPLNDPDLWWHLKTGETIVQNGDIPDKDPFAYTSPRVLSEGQKIGLRAQWLGQVIYYLASRTIGLTGIGILRGLLIILPAVILYIWLIRRNAGMLQALAVLLLPTLFFSLQLFYSFERPQGLSFSLSLIVVILLERLKRKSLEPGLDIAYLLLPLSMAAWSNLHGGFIVGNIIIIIYMASEAFLWIFRKFRLSATASVKPVFFSICLVAIAASFINPNKYTLFYSYFKGLFSMFVSDVTRYASGKGSSGWVRDVVLEYKPLYYFYKNLAYDWLIIYWIFTAVLYLSMFIKYWLRRSIDLAEFLTVSFVVVFANMYARGLMFSLPIMTLYMAKTVVEIKALKINSKTLLRSMATLMLVLAIVFSSYTYRFSPSFLLPGVSPTWITPWYPTRAVEFLRKNHIAPPMYNYYTWGGFLIWALYPEYKVFIDGRAIDNWASQVADSMLKAFRGWQQQFEAYRINFIVIPTVFRESGHIIPLATELVNDDRWKLVFVANNSAIFVRDVPRNRDIIQKYNIDKKRVYIEIIDVENILLYSMPANPVYNLAKADSLFALGRYAEAKAIYAKFPSASSQQLRKLRSMGY